VRPLSYLECPDAVRKDIDDFFRGSRLSQWRTR
jgi:hypothetical protein